MKNTMEYMIGNNAVQIINTGKKIRVVDVKKRRTRKCFVKKAALMLALSTSVFLSCFLVVTLHNTVTTMERQNYALKNEIAQLSRENYTQEKEQDNEAIDYNLILKKAKALGMDFPSREQIYEYDADRSSAVRINAE